MKGVYRAIAGALLAPLLVLAVTASAFTGLRCRMTGMVSVDTCCPVASQDPPLQSSVGEPGCCERFVVANAKPAASPSVPVADGVLVPPLVFAIAPAALVPVPVDGRAAIAFSSARVPKPPLRLLKRSLLI